MSSGNSVLSERRGDVAVLTLNDPDRMNPVSDVMRVALLAAIEAAHLDPEVRVLVLTGAGGNFTAGADVRQMENPGGGIDPDRFRRRLIPLQRCVEQIAGGPKPVVAAVEGNAFGLGFSFALICDWIVASETARFAAAFGKVGLTADCGLAWSLPQRVGIARARDIMMTARPVKAAEALEIGLVDQLVPEGSALDLAIAKAAEYRVVAPLALSAMKAGFVLGPGSLAETLALERQQQPMLSMTGDHQEAVAAFKEKRPPTFRGR